MSNEENALLVQLEPTTVREFFTDPDQVSNVINKIRSIVATEEHDAGTAKGRAAIKSLAYKVKRSKTYLDDAGKELVAELKELPKLIDSNRKTIRDELDSLHDQVRKPLTEWENEVARRAAEEKEQAERAEAVRKRITEFSLEPTHYINATSEVIHAAVGRMELVVINEDYFGDLYEEAATARLSAVEKMRTMAANAEIIEQREREERERAIAEEAAERERQASEQKIIEAKLAAERAEAEKKEAEQRAIDAENRRKEAEEKAVADRKRAEDEAAERERKRIEAAQESERRAEEARARDIEHKKKIHNEAVVGLSDHAGLDDTQAKAVVIAIARRLIPNITIAY
jgi:hypothetical protein